MSDEDDMLSRVLWVLSRIKVTPAEWDESALVIDKSLAYPPDTNYPTKVALYPAPGTDRWWGPDADFVNEDTDDLSFPLAQAIAALAVNVVLLLKIDCEHPRSSEAAQAWWDGMTEDIWNHAADVVTTCGVCGGSPLWRCSCEPAGSAQ